MIYPGSSRPYETLDEVEEQRRRVNSLHHKGKGGSIIIVSQQHHQGVGADSKMYHSGRAPMKKTTAS